MSQASIVISNASGAAVRAAVNSALEAMTTGQSGATAPSPTFPYMIWNDTANDLARQRNAANSAWIIKGTLSAEYGGLPASGITYNPGSPAILSATDVQAAIDELVSAGNAPRGHIWGLTVTNNGIDATNDIDIAEGETVSQASPYSMMSLSASVTRQLDVAFGSGNGGRFDSSISDGTWHVFVISNGSSVNVGMSKSPTPTGETNYPSGYTRYRRIWSIQRVAGVIRPFYQNGDTCLWKTATEAFDVTASTTPQLVNVQTPADIVTEPMLNVLNASGSVYYLFTSPNVDSQAAGASAPYASLIENSGSFGRNISGRPLLTNTSSEIRLIASGSAGIKGAALGYIDRRGRNGSA